MTIINLDPAFNPVHLQTVRFSDVEGQNPIIEEADYKSPEVKVTKFPAGELSVYVDPEEMDETGMVYISTRLQSSDDWFVLLNTFSALLEMGMTIGHVYVPYLPASREDRPMVQGSSFGLRVTADLFNAFGVPIFTFHPHSDVARACFGTDSTFQVPYSWQTSQITKHVNEDKNTPILLVAPDAGASKMVNSLAKVLDSLGYHSVEVIQGYKTRNVKTGKIEKIGLLYDDDIHPMMPVFIVDDICDGGGTFLPLAEQLQSKGAHDINLVVSHGIFSHGFDGFMGLFNKIYTTNSIRRNLDYALPEFVEETKLIAFTLTQQISNFSSDEE